MGCKELKPIASNRARERRHRSPEDRRTKDEVRGAVTKVTRSTYNKGRITDMKKDTLKSLERATHLHVRKYAVKFCGKPEFMEAGKHTHNC